MHRHNSNSEFPMGTCKPSRWQLFDIRFGGPLTGGFTVKDEGPRARRRDENALRRFICVQDEMGVAAGGIRKLLANPSGLFLDPGSVSIEGDGGLVADEQRALALSVYGGGLAEELNLVAGAHFQGLSYVGSACADGIYDSGN